MVVSNMFFHPRTLGKMNPFWRAYFSDGLKPPTRQTPNHKHMSSRNHPQLTVDGRKLALWIMEDDPGNGKKLWLFRVYRGWNTSNYVVVLVNHYKYDKDPYCPTSMMESTRVFFRGSPGLWAVMSSLDDHFLFKWWANFRNKVSRSVLLVHSKGIEWKSFPQQKECLERFRLRKNLHRWGGAMNYVNYIIDH